MKTELDPKAGKRVHDSHWYAYGLIALILPQLIGFQTAWGDPPLLLSSFIVMQGPWSSHESEERILSHIEKLTQSCYDYYSSLNPMYYLTWMQSCPSKSEIPQFPTDFNEPHSAIYYAALYDYPRVIQRLKQNVIQMGKHQTQAEIHRALCKKLKHEEYYRPTSLATFKILTEIIHSRLNDYCRKTRKRPLEVLWDNLLQMISGKNENNLQHLTQMIEIFKTLVLNGAQPDLFVDPLFIDQLVQESIKNDDPNYPQLIVRLIDELLPNHKRLIYKTFFLAAAKQGKCMKQVIITLPRSDLLNLEFDAESALETAIFGSHQLEPAAALLGHFPFRKETIQSLHKQVSGEQQFNQRLSNADRKNYEGILEILSAYLDKAT